MCEESSWLIVVSICKVFNPTLDEDDHSYKSSLIRAESQQKQQAKASSYQAVKMRTTNTDSPNTRGDSSTEMCNAQQTLLGVSWNFPCCVIS